MIRLLLIFALTLISTSVMAAPALNIISSKSNITFTAIQNNSPITGTFEKFSGEINFDPDQLNTSKMRIVVDMNSVTTSYSEVADTLKTAPWFDVKHFPQAIFTADHFTHVKDNIFQADGKLTLRDKTLPISLTFALKEYPPTDAKATGSTTFKRTAFGVGQGEWQSTTEVKDDVKVDFTVATSRKQS